MSDKIYSIFMKYYFFYFFFFLMYIVSFAFSAQLVGDSFPYTYGKISIMILITSATCFVTTILVHLLYLIHNNEQAFKNMFEVTNLVNLFISGLCTVLLALKKPLQISDNPILDSPESFAMIGVIFFVALFNYNLYKPFFINGDIQLHSIKNTKDALSTAPNHIRKLVSILLVVVLGLLIWGILSYVDN